MKKIPAPVPVVAQVAAVMDASAQTWKALNDSLMDMTEQQVLQTLDAERAGQNRYQFLLRIHSRYNVLRAQRERLELITGCGTTIKGK